MNRVMTNGRIAETSPRFQAGIAYLYYLLTILAGAFVLFIGSRLNFLVDVIATTLYVAVTALFYALTKKSVGVLSEENEYEHRCGKAAEERLQTLHA